MAIFETELKNTKHHKLKCIILTWHLDIIVSFVVLCYILYSINISVLSTSFILCKSCTFKKERWPYLIRNVWTFWFSLTILTLIRCLRFGLQPVTAKTWSHFVWLSLFFTRTANSEQQARTYAEWWQVTQTASTWNKNLILLKAKSFLWYLT